MNKPKFSANLLMPQHWPAWIVIGLFAALTFLPYRLQLSLGKAWACWPTPLLDDADMWQKLTLAYVFLKRATPNKLSLYDKPLLTTVSVSLKLLSAGLGAQTTYCLWLSFLV